jgi:hypothetical protein
MGDTWTSGRMRPLHAGGTLGENLRAGRLGFGWSAWIGAWMQVAGEADKDGCWKIELVPGGADFPKRAVAFRCWWEDPDRVVEGHVAAVVAGDLRPVRLRRPLTLHLPDGQPLLRR